jgi:hypothetical protein
MEETYIYLLEAQGYKLKPVDSEKFQEESVISDFAFTTQEAADNFIPEWKNTLIEEQGFIEQSGFQLEIRTKQIRLLAASEE